MDPRLADVPGFGDCGSCAYRESGPASLCFACARQAIDRVTDWAGRCEVCDLRFNPGDIRCANPLCNDNSRWFMWNWAIAMRSGELERAINRYKYQDRYGWAWIFGRVLAGFLDERSDAFRGFDLITASPTFVGEGGRTFDHTRLVLERAAMEEPTGRGWPFDVEGDPSIVKSTSTPALMGLRFKERRQIAQAQLRDSLSVPDHDRVRGQRILVYDDVFTDGLTLNEVGRALIQAGADSVCGVTLCRQPWRGQTPGR